MDAYNKLWKKNCTNTYWQNKKNLILQELSTYAADVGNVFKGVNEVIPVRGFNYRQCLCRLSSGSSDQPIMGTEMGSTVTTRGIYEKDSIRGLCS